ncbi:MAG: GGDEF domain-containing protein [Butyribacter sp.]|nr:GGDEF domain-containing protein [bacterium]MDY3853762.1 GGDEF domain-containing protein [Butyribacter sp.]
MSAEKDEKRIKEQLFKIIAEKRIKPVYQPIVSLRDGEVIGYEALSRIELDDCVFSVEEMFEYATKYECLWTLEYICRKKAIKEARAELGHKKLFLNVEPYIFNDERFKAGMTKNYLKRYGISPDNIVFEISERTDITEVESFQQTVKHYEEQEYEIAIDDFGKGYAGFNRIFFLQPRFVKIDISLIKDIDKDSVKASMVAGFAKYCKDDGIFLIAEGVETKAELEKLVQIGVDYAQGYFLGKPKANMQKIPRKIQEIIINENRATTRIQSAPSFFGNIGAICHRVGTTTCDTKAIAVFEYMQKNPEVTEICVVDNEKKVHGLLTKQYIDECFGGRYGYNLYSRKKVIEMLEPNFLEVDSRMPIEKVAKLALIRPRHMLYDAIVVSDNGRYDGLVTVKDLLEASITIQVERAMDTNPLTHLPGNLQIEKQIESHLFTKKKYSIMYLDLDNFKAYNDAYGFENGDLMLKAVARCMKEACKGNEFMGHIGGDDFVIISEEYNLSDIFQKVIESFHLCLEELYSKEDYAKKEIYSKNRHGEAEVFPLASISGALLTNEKAVVQSMEDFSAKIARTKKASKQVSGDSLMIYGEDVS